MAVPGLTLHRSPSVGGIIKKMLEINPQLGTAEMIAFVRQATIVRSAGEGFAEIETVDEELAIRLARESSPSKSKDRPA